MRRARAACAWRWGQHKITNHDTDNAPSDVNLMSGSSPHAPQSHQPVVAVPPYSHLLAAGDGPSVEFDEALGAYMGIPAMSNRDDSFFSGERFGCGCCFHPAIL